jgi:hypothetical protein
VGLLMAGRVIHKYEVGYGQGVAHIPPSAKVIHAATVPISPTTEGVFVWVEVDPSEDAEPRKIGCFATGDLVPDDALHVGTAVTPTGAFVWHVYEQQAS